MTEGTDMSQTIEKVARAMCRADPEVRMGDADGVVEQRVNIEWAHYVDQAKAAIAAMQPAPQWQGIESAQRSLMDQIKHDAALVAALPEHERKNYERELRSLFCNPGITFPTPSAGGSDEQE